MKAHPDLLISTVAGGSIADPEFQSLLAARGYVRLSIDAQAKGILTAFLQAVIDTCSSADGAYGVDATTFALLQVASASAMRTKASLKTVKPFMQHHRLLTRAEAKDLVTAGAPCVDIDLADGVVLHLLRNDVAASLFGLRVLLNEVDVEAAARRATSHMDWHEGEPQREVDIEMADALFREAFPTFRASLLALGSELDDLGEVLDWTSPRLARTDLAAEADEAAFRRGAETLGINDLRRRYENYRG
ncbi:hypothetical protein ASG63_08595 [Methylobacterium sp. Leaf94]|uniref:hypothetical protein n=1 Tax=Methylobacterium sp. Leaf94 TaxID=1736250 RepID=UPI0006FC7484|nr:hypothetical protein [Methylobacterium sp. Leaf94]KQU17560.1 hypothetical protein ASG63_08595 [Methylobacterium sp. Leaf94]